MSTLVDDVWAKLPTASSVLQKAAGDATVSDTVSNWFNGVKNAVMPPKPMDFGQQTAPAPAPVTPPPPPAPTPDDSRVEIQPRVAPAVQQQAAVDAAAPFHGQLENVISGKDHLVDLGLKNVRQIDTSSVDPMIAQRNFSGLNLGKYLPTKDLDKLSPQQLGQAQRALLVLSKNERLAALRNERMFDNPSEGDPKLTLDEVGNLYRTQSEKLQAEQQADYAKGFYPNAGEEAMTSVGVNDAVRKAVAEAPAQLQTAIKEVEADPKGTGFQDWFTESWGNIAVPAGMLLMMFGGDTGAVLGGLAVAAGGYDIYNRYNTLTKDPIAQTAIKTFVDGKFSKDALEGIRKNLGDKYAKSALDFMALSRYGFLSAVQGKYRDAGLKAYKSYLPSTPDKDVEAYGKTLPGATPAQNTWGNDWANKAWETGKGWLKGTPAAETPVAAQ